MVMVMVMGECRWERGIAVFKNGRFTHNQTDFLHNNCLMHDLSKFSTSTNQMILLCGITDLGRRRRSFDRRSPLSRPLWGSLIGDIPLHRNQQVSINLFIPSPPKQPSVKSKFAMSDSTVVFLFTFSPYIRITITVIIKHFSQ